VADDAAFEAFYRSEHERMVRALTLALGDRSLAEDCAQVGFERAYARWDRMSQYEKPGAWVYVVAVRHGWKTAKRRSGPTGQRTALADGSTSIDGDLWFAQVVQQLPPRQREALVLRHLADLTLADVAKAQRVSVGTVKASLHAAYRRLRVDVAEVEEVHELEDR
jgi:RNA polymerase sigma-70 factor (ECF subfamily)